jgi:hypothetical protein
MIQRKRSPLTGLRCIAVWAVEHLLTRFDHIDERVARFGAVP